MVLKSCGLLESDCTSNRADWERFFSFSTSCLVTSDWKFKVSNGSVYVIETDICYQSGCPHTPECRLLTISQHYLVKCLSILILNHLYIYNSFLCLNLNTIIVGGSILFYLAFSVCFCYCFREYLDPTLGNLIAIYTCLRLT